MFDLIKGGDIAVCLSVCLAGFPFLFFFFFFFFGRAGLRATFRRRKKPRRVEGEDLLDCWLCGSFGF